MFDTISRASMQADGIQSMERALTETPPGDEATDASIVSIVTREATSESDKATKVCLLRVLLMRIGHISRRTTFIPSQRADRVLSPSVCVFSVQSMPSHVTTLTAPARTSRKPPKAKRGPPPVNLITATTVILVRIPFAPRPRVEGPIIMCKSVPVETIAKDNYTNTSAASLTAPARKNKANVCANYLFSYVYLLCAHTR